jgi:hypothetical protein
MQRLLRLVLGLAWVTTSGAVRALRAEPAAVRVARHALIVGSNAGGTGQLTLRYAEDDAGSWRAAPPMTSEVIALPPLELPDDLAPARSWLARRWRLARRWWREGRRARPVRPVRRRWWPALAFAAGLAAIAFALFVVIGPSESKLAETSRGVDRDVVSVKGVGEVRIELVRERAGEIRYDALLFARGDRWKVIVTCAPSADVWVEISVNDGVTIDRPIPPAQLICGNRVVVPGAFTITGIGAHRVCARIASGPGAAAAVACTTLRPE